MADITNQKLGGTGTSMNSAGGAICAYRVVADITKAVADGLTTGEQIDLMTIPDGAYFVGLDAEIVEALSASTDIDIGTTEGDPDEYLDADSNANTAVGRFTAYTAACVTPVINVGEKTLRMEVATPATGKIAVTVWMGVPATENEEKARPRVYDNV